MSEFNEVQWTFEVDGRRYEGTRTEHINRRTDETGAVLYTIDPVDGVSGSLTFRGSLLEPLRAFLAAMDSGPGIPVLRCRHCDTDLHYEVRVDQWLDRGNESTCPELSDRPHEPRSLATEY